MELDLDTLKYIQHQFSLYSDTTVHSLGYSWLKRKIEELESKQSSITAVVQAKPEKVCICNQIVIAGATGFCPKCKTEWV
jgi:hypothetical protein